MEGAAHERTLEDLRWLEGLARRLVRDPEEASDLTQEAWLASIRRVCLRLVLFLSKWLRLQSLPPSEGRTCFASTTGSSKSLKASPKSTLTVELHPLAKATPPCEPLSSLLKSRLISRVSLIEEFLLARRSEPFTISSGISSSECPESSSWYDYEIASIGRAFSYWKTVSKTWRGL